MKCLPRGRIGEREARACLARPDAVIEIVGSEGIHPRQRVAQRHVLAEGNAVHLVVAAAGLPAALDQDGRVVAAPPVCPRRDWRSSCRPAHCVRQRAAIRWAISRLRSRRRAVAPSPPNRRVTRLRPDNQVGTIIRGEVGQTRGSALATRSSGFRSSTALSLRMR